MTNRSEHEIQHGLKLASGDPEKTWGWGTEAGRLRARRRAEMICGGASLRPGTRVLEIGCGSGLFTGFIAETGATVVAVDISGELLKLARQRTLPNSRVTFLQKRFEDCDVDGPFDAVAGSSVLHHLDIIPALKKIFELLKPGGVLSFAEPNMLNPQIMVQKNVPWIKARMGDSPDETAFFRWQMHMLLRSSGFERIEVLPFDWLHPYTPSWLIRFVSGAGKLVEKTPLIREFAGSLYIRAFRPLSL
jgi:2-polyprenyl-3-methyl-5-hydroxy-6-metoxy-1,4-benzoquinol methylase